MGDTNDAKRCVTITSRALPLTKISRSLVQRRGASLRDPDNEMKSSDDATQESEWIFLAQTFGFLLSNDKTFLSAINYIFGSFSETVHKSECNSISLGS